jgi:SAM-dependent methyltransferase
VQRYGWDLAARDYEPLWQAQLAPAHDALIAAAAFAAGERVLDIACGTGLVSLAAARAVGPAGQVVGVDISARMVDAARERAGRAGLAHARFERMDAEHLELPGAGFDVVTCALGLMYLPDPERAVREMLRQLRPGGRVVLAVWGERSRCGWAPVFPIVDAEVRSEVCPLFFRLGQPGALARLCAALGGTGIEETRLAVTLDYPDADVASDAALVGGPVALAWSRFDAAVRARVRRAYLDAIAPWRHGRGYRVPGEFVVVAARKPRETP